MVVCFWFAWFLLFLVVFFGFLLGQLAGLRTGPLPVLLWLSTSRQPCMIITIHLFALACLGCPCFGWPLPLRFSCGFPFMVLRGSSLSLLLFGVSEVVAVSFFALVAWVLAAWPALFWFPPPSPPPLVVFWCFLVQSVFCWSLPPDIWLYLQRSGCHTFGMACRG